MKLYTAGQMKAADEYAINTLGISGTALMKNAAANLARTALEALPKGSPAAVFCGVGNNGGDGLATAEYLIKAGVETRVFILGNLKKITNDSSAMLESLRGTGCEPESFAQADRDGVSAYLKGAGLIIDAIFGIGLHSDLRDEAVAAVELINASSARIISADIPTGVNADSGQIMGVAVNADMTVTFSAPKAGHFAQPGCLNRGKLIIADIGIPVEALDRIDCSLHAVSRSDVYLPRRDRLGHKGDFGRVLIIAGSVGYTGAASMCAGAAVRTGAGLVFLGIPSDIYNIIAIKSEVAMPFPLPGTDSGRLSRDALPAIEKILCKSSSLVIGPGLGRSEELTDLVLSIIRRTEIPTVVDADGLFALKGELSVLREAKAPIILTPHEGEFKYLAGSLAGDRISQARDFAKTYGCVLALKGHRTICAFPDGDVFINTTGNPGMAKGGSGDVLAGAMGALLNLLPLKEAVYTAVWLCGEAGDVCAEDLGEYGMTAEDLIQAIPQITKQITYMR